MSVSMRPIVSFFFFADKAIVSTIELTNRKYGWLIVLFYRDVCQ